MLSSCSGSSCFSVLTCSIVSWLRANQSQKLSLDPETRCGHCQNISCLSWNYYEYYRGHYVRGYAKYWWESCECGWPISRPHLLERGTHTHTTSSCSFHQPAAANIHAIGTALAWSLITPLNPNATWMLSMPKAFDPDDHWFLKLFLLVHLEQHESPESPLPLPAFLLTLPMGSSLSCPLNSTLVNTTWMIP